MISYPKCQPKKGDFFWKKGVDFWLEWCYIKDIIRKQKEGKMLELIGFIAIAYVIFKLAPVVLEVGFKFAVICLGLGAFLIIAAIFTSQITVWLS